MKGREFDQAIAEAQVDGMPLEEARVKAWRKLRNMGQSSAPDTWKQANRHWRAVVNELYGPEVIQKAHAALKKKHGVDSFTKLTIGQIWASIERIEEAHRAKEASRESAG